ncbi:anhydro-N-acetylmuramic acid kinase [Chryseobacterium sp.]|uniref:anhydro-N-acetylmuramic acid kinase n=1 Tax=Chryseobacterium sp. TaxID=1871047 RepID=UPI0011CAE1B5|nr:anhydro-N-acetylmuramic acid kinase [Chryseobacterium sp.]TXF74955.1 anhydro-N-acetylmuramic acid kinase [Chryseobacterium sp.]
MMYQVIGLMSGTSLDGLDLCFVRFQKNEKWQFEILQAETIPYPIDWEEKLRNSILLSSEELLEFHSEYGFYLGKQVNAFIQKYQLENVDFIASHGHTVFHNPKKKYTFQLGDGMALKATTGIPVIYDFRSQDVILGGNGAPLVPIGDELLFKEYSACLNLGGFSNISMKKEGKRIAFDICPVNIMLNRFAAELGKKYDENGLLARNGIVDAELLSFLNALDFYSQGPPKSLGIEWVIKEINPIILNRKPEDLLATFTEHAAVQISKVFNTYALKNVLVSGGGTFNSYLMEKVQRKTQTEIIIPDEKIIHFKEALIFAFMGMLRTRNEINVLASATGSIKDHSSGINA